MTITKFLRERYHLYQSLSRDEWRQAVKRGMLQRAIEGIAIDLHDGRISLDEAVARASQAAERLDATHLNLSFPLEDRLN